MRNRKQIGLLVCAVLVLSILACRISTGSLGSATAPVPGTAQGMTNAAPTQPNNQEIGSGTPLGNLVWSNAGLAGEKVMTLVFDPNSPTTVYAGIYSGFIEKSNDSGGTWQTLSNGLANLKGKACSINEVAGVITCNNTVTNIQTFGSLTIDPQASTTLYGGALEGGMVKSVDGGESWIQINQGLTNSMVTSTILDPVSPVTLFIATNGGGISKSMDGGNNWISAGSDIWGVNQFAIDPLSPTSVYAATQKGVEKTTDGGASWSLLVNGMDQTDLAIHTIAVDPKTPTTIYAGAFSDLYKSVDGGNTWSISDSGMINPFVNSLAVNPVAPDNIYAATDRGFYKSVDSGATWTQVSDTGLPGKSVNCIAIDPKTPNLIYVGTDGGVFKGTP